MAVMQRRKGASGERELFNILRDELGVIVERNLAQTRAGGADSISLPGVAIEVKRQEKPMQEAWWRQAQEQAQSESRTPVLAYRRSRQPWRFVVPLEWVTRQPIYQVGLRCELGLREFCFLAREQL